MSRSTNPFEDDSPASAPVKSYRKKETAEDEMEYYERELEKYMQESLDSTERSKKHLVNSEQIGLHTAQELAEQREKLEKTEKNLDEIHRTTQQTQRNLNSIKSVFGGFFKNKFSRKPSDTTPATVSHSKSAAELKSTSEAIASGGLSSSSSSSMPQHTLSDSSRAKIKGTRWEAMDNQIDSNLNDMSANLRNLQQLGISLGGEIEDQNKMLDRIQSKAERNDATVRHQDQQMKKILGYKPTPEVKK